MDHIELLKMQEQHKRLERLVNSLCLYVEENTTMQAFEERFSSEDWQSAGAPAASSDSDSSLSEETGSGRRSPDAPPACASNDSLETKLTTPSPGPQPDPFDGPANQQATQTDPDSQSSPPSRALLPESRTGTISDAFSRAANLIQEATDMDGIVFLDASPSGFSTRLSPKSANPSMNVPVSQSTKSVRMCEVLGASTSSEVESGVSSEDSSEQDLPMSGPSVPEPFLQRLLRAHPQGVIFFADEVDDLGKHEGDAGRLFKIFSSARSILFLPLWDYQKEGWHAAAFGWSNRSNRVFTSDDMVYISAFSNSIMNEVSRIEAMNVSHAKSNFISSISHELRSPLHGILASTELLKQTGLDEERLALAEMIEVCGTTLLETMDHLLDFAKINHLTRRRRSSGSPTGSRGGSRGGSRNRNDHLSLSKTTDLSALVQEVVEGAYLGHSAQSCSRLETAGIRIHARQPPKPKHSLCTEDGCNPVLLTMDIEKHSNWRIHTEPGAWRRIVLNLVGNALKYTEHGFIEVSLKQVDAVKQQPSTLTEDKSHTAQRYICFSVKDSGRGISPEYLKYRLFTPYAQEDTLVSGTGLGLSIVHHLVTHLGGKVDIKSEVGVGTFVQVTIPVPFSAESVTPEIKSERNPMEKTGQLLRGKCIATLESTQLDEEARKLVSNAVRTAQAWYGLEVLPGNSIEGRCPTDFSILHVSQLEQESEARLRTLGGAVIALCTAAPTPKQMEAAALCDATLLQQPFGPKKVKTAFKAAFRRHNKLSTGQPVTSPLDLDSPPPNNHIEIPYREGATAISLPAPTDFNLAPTPMRRNFTLPTTAPSPFPPSPSPSHRATPPPELPSSSSSNAPSEPRLRLLLVEDNPINLRILTTYARKLNCTWVTASNGRDAVHEFKQADGRFDYVLMDVSMPIMNGFEATREIRAWERMHDGSYGPQHAKILALTGLGSAESQQEAFASGMDKFLIKPVPLARLQRVLFGDKSSTDENLKD
ncbi:hypothetical protein MPH_06333 [Macrophomina phaseolina MS6]|uniref:Uncharacterized protein n=1 Tax=Macrophomina phaseolina (strain MS6) TaxID=1126212 RepID=K2RV47_MACPH|nr:hypothetical protein MPH_06333 [Macrophomina phaseolina MS6]